MQLASWARWGPLTVAGVVFCALILAAGRSAADDLTYTSLDDATVRVFSFNGVELERVKGSSQRVYAVASPAAGHGTGLLVTKDGVVLTARHVIEDARMVAVQFPGEDQAVPARVAYADPAQDYAFLVVSGAHKMFVPLPERKQKLAVRQVVYVIGYPLDASRTHPQSQQGIVSGVLADGSLQLGIALNPGNSGGPVVDANEHLVGIAVARADPKLGAQGIGIAVPLDHILASYAKMTKGGDLERARRELGRDNKTLAARANLLAAMLTSVDAGNAWQALQGKKEAAPTSPTVDQLVDAALHTSSSPDPDVLSVAAAQAWNAAAVSIERGQSPKGYLSKARDLAQRARSADPDVLNRSPFVSFALDHGPADTNPAVPTKEESDGGESGGGRTQGNPTDVLMASLDSRETIPVIRAGPTLGLVTPFQVIGIGAVAKLRFADLITVDARYQYGAHLSRSGLDGGHLFEALGGVAVGTWHSHTTAQLIVDVEHAAWQTVYRYVPGEVPSTHSLVVEGGVVSGPVNLKSSASAMPPSADFVQQLFFLEGGVRYVYFYHANSQYLERAARRTFEASAHVVVPPLGAPDGSTNADGRAIGGVPGFDVNVAWDSLLSFGQTELGGGYYPSGDWIYVRLGWSYLFY